MGHHVKFQRNGTARPLFVCNTDICNWLVGWTETQLTNITVHLNSPFGYATGNKLNNHLNLLLNSRCVMLYLHPTVLLGMVTF
jgi:hypothetical protein